MKIQKKELKLNQLLTTTYRAYIVPLERVCIYVVSSLGLARPGHRPVNGVHNS